MAIAFGQMITKRIKGVSVGQRFGRLVVLRFVREQVRGYWRTLAVCKCDCGEESVKCPSRLRCGNTKSCICLRDEGPSNVITHGDTRNRKVPTEYKTWSGMLSRCENPKNAAYADYGGRGIKVCERWHRYEAFLEDMGRRPSSKHTVDRWPNNDGDYEPGNCRWATWFEQASNTRQTALITFNGETFCQSEWARRLGIDRGTLSRRIRSGWTVAEALTRKDGRLDRLSRQPSASATAIGQTTV